MALLLGTRRDCRLRFRFGSAAGSACARISWRRAGAEPVDLLALLAEALAEKLFELVLKLLVEMDLLVECREQLAYELMSGIEIVGELIRRGGHTLYYGDACLTVGAMLSES